MERLEPNEFSGVIGVVARGSLRLGNGINGLVFLFAVLAIGFVFGMLHAPIGAQLAGQAIFALFLARIALNAVSGETAGTVFSTAGGGWPEVGAVAARYLTLTVLWLLPVALIGAASSGTDGDAAVAAALMAGGEPSSMLPGLGGVTAALMAYALLSGLTPPVFLIVAVGAGSFGDLFSPDHWRSRFSGRLGDLFMVYVAYTGVLGMCVVCSVPILLGLAGLSWKLAALAAVGAVVLAAGIVIDLLGRLCGFFAIDEGGEEPVAGTQDPGIGSSPEVRGEVVPRPPTAPSTIPLSGAGDPATRGKPPLDDAPTHVQTAKRRFAEEPAVAIASLEELRKTHAPHPQILHTLWSFQIAAGQPDAALAVALEALPTLVQRGNVALAAHILRTHWARRNELRLDRASLLAIAGANVQAGDLTDAANAYAMVLHSDKRDPRAIKGILGVAERLHTTESNPDAAVRLYRFLLRTAPESPLVEFMQQGLTTAEHKLSQSKAG